MRKEKKDCEKGFEENDRWYYYSYWSSSCSCNHFNGIRFAKMGATLWLLFFSNRKFLRISYYTKTGAGMRTRAYKEDVATQPRSAREFALQTLCYGWRFSFSLNRKNTYAILYKVVYYTTLRKV